MKEAVEGIYEYWQIQRQGKTTLMVRDMLRLNEFYGVDWSRFHTNFVVRIPRVNCHNSPTLLQTMVTKFKAKEPDLVWVFDELGQFLGARNYMNTFQTEIANDLWQFPKRNWILLYSDNVGLSADKTIRLATWQSIFPVYVHGETRQDDHIRMRIIYNYEHRISPWIVLQDVWQYQRLFDTREPID